MPSHVNDVYRRTRRSHSGHACKAVSKTGQLLCLLIYHATPDALARDEMLAMKCDVLRKAWPGPAALHA
ncbi:hypothetical protein ACTMU2_15915 [Cupriavidus basilensis]